MAFVMDRKTLLAINRRAADMLREMDKRGDPFTSPGKAPSRSSGSEAIAEDADLWPSPTTQFSLEEIREAFRIANKRLNSLYASETIKAQALPDESDGST
ncbi:hypothetical protein RBA41_06945 [Massilia sp. CCM 9210]|uniref:hypothetical protein n=1 Tax=Massilia scottii TaxID=3057166 RepID=UPI0027967364|nr:hypothetical protein [Massilia sp. CCM 9210]MDQ1813039.1 hypothetical protein [Massilia sp. CCM 9210]